MEKIVLVAGIRSPFGKWQGALKKVKALDLLHLLGEKLFSQVPHLDRKKVDAVFLGQVLQAGHGQNLARQLVRSLGCKEDAVPLMLNMVCGSGLQSVVQAIQQLQLKESYACLVGGIECMSQAPYLFFDRSKEAQHSVEILYDSLFEDALKDGLEKYTMFSTAERLAQKFSLSREAQDDFALASHQKAEKAYKEKLFSKELCPFWIEEASGKISMTRPVGEARYFEKDEVLRENLSLEALQKLKTLQAEGTVTAGNASALTDGACLLLLMRASDAKKEGLTPLLSFGSYAYGACAPEEMGFAPVNAIKNLLVKEKSSLQDYAFLEMTEAFAAQSLAVLQALPFPVEKVNLQGGALAVGHPLGASGARLVLSSLTCLEKTSSAQTNKGLISLCIGGGNAIALSVEKFF